MGRSGKASLRLALDTSSKAWTALVDGKPEAMFGVVVEDLLSGIGTPWFLGTDEVYRHGRELLAWGPVFLSRLSAGLTLSNCVSAKNKRAIRLLEHWGFEVSSEVLSCGGVEFRRFSRSRDAR